VEIFVREIIEVSEVIDHRKYHLVVKMHNSMQKAKELAKKEQKQGFTASGNALEPGASGMWSC
jgi:hypothetical protein